MELDELRGKHQNMLINPNPKTPIDFVFPILNDLIIDVSNSDSESVLEQVSKKQLILKELPIQDIQFIMVKIRETSYAKEYYLDLNCPHCEHTNKAALDLSSLEVFPRVDKLPEEEMKLPKEGIEFRYGHMNLAHLLKMAIEDENSDFIKEIITSTTSFLVKSLGDNNDVKPSDLEELRASDVNFIKDNAPKLAEIDLKVEHTCSSCKEDFESELPVLAADFLLHSRT